MFPLKAGQGHVSGPMIAADHLARLMKLPLDRTCHDGELLAQGLLKSLELYKSDFVIVFSDVTLEAEVLGVKVEYSAQRNPHIISSVDTNQIPQVRMMSSGRMPQLFKAARICRDRLGADFPIFISMKDPFSLAALTIDPETFLTLLIDQPDVAGKSIDVCLNNQSNLIEDVCRAGFIPLIGAPMASGSMLGPGWFEKFVFNPMNTLFTLARESGSFACLHLCGRIGNLSEQLSRLSPDLLSFEEWEPKMWETLPETIPMGFVPTDLFSKGKAIELRKATRASLDHLPQPFVLSTACDLPANANPILVQQMMTTDVR